MNGKPPPPANNRHEDDTIRPAVNAFRKQYSKNLLKAVDWALEVDPELRPQSLDDFQQALQPVDSSDKSMTARIWDRISPKLTRTR
jgi:hypothetical protein